MDQTGAIFYIWGILRLPAVAIALLGCLGYGIFSKARWGKLAALIVATAVAVAMTLFPGAFERIDAIPLDDDAPFFVRIFFSLRELLSWDAVALESLRLGAGLTAGGIWSWKAWTWLRSRRAKSGEAGIAEPEAGSLPSGSDARHGPVSAAGPSLPQGVEDLAEGLRCAAELLVVISEECSDWPHAHHLADLSYALMEASHLEPGGAFDLDLRIVRQIADEVAPGSSLASRVHASKVKPADLLQMAMLIIRERRSLPKPAAAAAAPTEKAVASIPTEIPPQPAVLAVETPATEHAPSPASAGPSAASNRTEPATAAVPPAPTARETPPGAIGLSEPQAPMNRPDLYVNLHLPGRRK